MHSAESLVPDTSVYEVETATEKVKRKKSLGTDHIPA
jgi:hypothetical protein